MLMLTNMQLFKAVASFLYIDPYMSAKLIKDCDPSYK